MQWNNHFNLEGQHAFLGASTYSWLNYTPEKLKDTWSNMKDKERGTKLHAAAQTNINMKIRAAGRKSTMARYINDAISYGMSTEVPLVYSEYCFGTADAILFDEKNKTLRIHDLKTGTVTKGNLKQLKIYAALFCLEYGKKYDFVPTDDNITLCIYQNDEINEGKGEYHPTAEEIIKIMDKIIAFDKYLHKWNEEE